MPSIGDRLGQKIYAGPDYGYQSPASFQQLKDSDQLKLGAGLVRRFGSVLDRLEQARHNTFGTDSNAETLGSKANEFLQKSGFNAADDAAYEVGGAIAKRLGISPAIGGLALGMLVPGPGELKAVGNLSDAAKAARLPRRSSTGDPIATSRSHYPRVDPPKQTGPNSHKIVEVVGEDKKVRLEVQPKGTKTESTQGSHPGDRADLANRAEQRINQRLDQQQQGVRTQAEVEELLKGTDVWEEAKGPGSKKFGAYPKETTELQALTDRLGVKTPEHTRTSGRPSAANSLPGLKDIGAGKRKATALQERRDYLNRGREGDTPNLTRRDQRVIDSEKPRLSPTPEERAILNRTKPSEADVQRADAQAYKDNMASSPRGQTRAEEAVDFRRRRNGIAKPEKERTYKPDPEITVDGWNESIPGERARPGQRSIPAADRSQTPYQGARSSRDQGSGRTVKQEKYETHPADQPFNASGELKNIKERGQTPKGDQRSTQSINAARKTLTGIIERLESLPHSLSRTKRLEAFRKQLDKLN